GSLQRLPSSLSHLHSPLRKKPNSEIIWLKIQNPTLFFGTPFTVSEFIRQSKVTALVTVF
ncbi:hypothetical protein MKW98_006661, partial [Papaver atlanticum]